MGYKQQLKKLHRLSSPSKGAKAGHSAPDRLPVPTQSVQPALPHLMHDGPRERAQSEGAPGETDASRC